MIDFDGVGVTERVLDAAALRARVVMHNIANQNTPGFKRYTVSFEDRLAEAYQSRRAMRDVHAVVHRDESGPPGANNVSVVEELALLEKVELLHDVFSRRAGGYFNKLNRAISGRTS